jgi:mannose-6-phosphate isomerase-like protein (cupin superfamily)
MELDRVNLHALALSPTVAHRGVGEIGFCRVAEAEAMSGACNFIDVAVLPPGVSIGRHRHAPHEEEFYLVMKGRGRMWRDGEEFEVRAGDLIRNRAGGAHGLVNDGGEDLMIFVFELKVPTVHEAAL